MADPFVYGLAVFLLLPTTCSRSGSDTWDAGIRYRGCPPLTITVAAAESTGSYKHCNRARIKA
jgi:hypothetical protein